MKFPVGEEKSEVTQMNDAVHLRAHQHVHRLKRGYAIRQEEGAG